MLLDTEDVEDDYETKTCFDCGAVGYPAGQFNHADPDGDWVTRRMLTETWKIGSGRQLRCPECV